MVVVLIEPQPHHIKVWGACELPKGGSALNLCSQLNVLLLWDRGRQGEPYLKDTPEIRTPP